jgi:hypothetical protein
MLSDPIHEPLPLAILATLRSVDVSRVHKEGLASFVVCLVVFQLVAREEKSPHICVPPDVASAAR